MSLHTEKETGLSVAQDEGVCGTARASAEHVGDTGSSEDTVPAGPVPPNETSATDCESAISDKSRGAIRFGVVPIVGAGASVDIVAERGQWFSRMLVSSVRNADRQSKKDKRSKKKYKGEFGELGLFWRAAWIFVLVARK